MKKRRKKKTTPIVVEQSSLLDFGDEMGSRHKHTRFVNACKKYLEENSVESTTGFLKT